MKPLVYIRIFYFIFIISTTTTLFANELNQKIEEVFSKADTNATFVLYDMQKEKLIIHNQARAQRIYTPASTFKIANSLIGLETKAVKSVDEPLPYLGPKNPFIASWKEDMGLRKAIAISNVPAAFLLSGFVLFLFTNSTLTPKYPFCNLEEYSECK